MNPLLFKAFQALGPGATGREIDLVADILRAAGDKAVLEVLDAAAEDSRAFEALCGVAGGRCLRVRGT